MHINVQTYRTLKRTLAQVLHTRRDSHDAQHLNTLSLLICGIVGAQHVQFAQIADHVPIRRRKNERLITRFRRWITHAAIMPAAIWRPFARAVLDGLAQAPLTILLSGTTAGRGCMVLLARVVDRGRAIPVLWSVVKGTKGHVPHAVHCARLRHRQTVIPASAAVRLLGAGAFDGVAVQKTLRAATWDYVCRTGTNISIHAHERVFAVGDLPLKRGEAVAIDAVAMTRERYGPVLLMGVWDAKHAEPRYLISALTPKFGPNERPRAPDTAGGPNCA